MLCQTDAAARKTADSSYMLAGSGGARRREGKKRFLKTQLVSGPRRSSLFSARRGLGLVPAVTGPLFPFDRLWGGPSAVADLIRTGPPTVSAIATFKWRIGSVWHGVLPRIVRVRLSMLFCCCCCCCCCCSIHSPKVSLPHAGWSSNTFKGQCFLWSGARRWQNNGPVSLKALDRRLIVPPVCAGPYCFR